MNGFRLFGRFCAAPEFIVGKIKYKYVSGFLIALTVARAIATGSGGL